MRAEELRIGNKVLRKDLFSPNQEFKERTVDHNTITACYSNNENFKPIPITEEWLVKFGFQINNWLYGCSGTLDNIIVVIMNEEVVVSIQYGGVRVILEHIEYIHQLQNLRYELKGEELTIKE